MSTIDDRMVNLGFNNQQFEQGVQTSVKSLGNLKKGLDLDQSTRSLSALSAAGRAFSLQGISDNVANISSRFSAMGIVGITILQNLTNAAINLGEKLVRSALGIDEMRAGFASYEVKVNAVKTVMAGTGETIDQVTRSLDELNNYSDRTIYSFQDMTENISKFTNAGMSSKDAATVIQGISNVAAISGANTGEAARAMYNFGQAIQQGSVRLMDWKSIENANMATVGFKQQLIDSAVAAKTLTKQADGTYKTLKGEVLTAIKNFNGSLEQGWLTTKVLTDTLANYASQTTDIGKKANAAAQEVATFTQMMATAQDSVKTGWTKTSQIIFGDLDEAKAFYTEVSGVVGSFISASADSRNELLQSWKAFGGRQALIWSLRNSFEALMSVINPIKEAFATIFPPTTGYQIASITHALRTLTANFKMGEENVEKLKRTFYGIFAVFDLVKVAVFNLGKAFFGLFDSIGPAGNSLLDFTAKIGDFLLESRNAILFGDGWGAKVFDPIREKVAPAIKAFNDFNQAIAPFIKKVQDFTAKIGDFLLESRNAILFGDGWGAKVFDPIREKVAPAIKAFNDFNQAIAPFIKKVQDFYTEIKQSKDNEWGTWKDLILYSKYFGGIGNLINKLRESFTKFYADVSPTVEKVKAWWEKLFPPKINVGPVTSSIDTFAGKVKEQLGPLATIFDTLGKVFNWFGEVLVKLSPIIGKIGLLIAQGIGELGKSIMKGIDELDFNKVIDAINTGLLASFVLLVKKFTSGDGFGAAKGILDGVTGVLDGVKGSLVAWQNNLKSKTLMTIATAIAILAVSLIALSLVDSGKLTTALLAVSVMFTEMIGTMEIMSKIPGGKNVSVLAGQLVLIAAAVGLLSLSVIALAKLDPVKLAQGLVGVGVLLTELVLFMKVTKLDSTSSIKGAGLLVLGLALLVISSAVEKMGNIDTPKLVQGLIAIGVVLGMLVAFTKLTGNNIMLMATATAMTILGGALLIFGSAVEKLGALPIYVLVNGLGAMAVVLAEIVVAMKLMPKNMIISALGMLMVANAIKTMVGPLTMLGKMSLEEILKSLGMLAGTFGILILAMQGMTNALPGAAAMLVVAVALAVLTPSLQALGSMSLTEIGLALLAMAGAFVIFGIAGAVLGPMTPVLISLTGAIVLFGLGLLAVGMGVLAFATGMSMLAAAGAGGAAAITLLAASVLGLIPMIVAALVNGILTFITLILQALPAIVDALAKIGMAIINAIVLLIPGVVAAILQLITGLINALVDNMPALVEAGYKLLNYLLGGLLDHIGDVTKTVIKIITEFLDTVSEQLPDIIKSGWNLLLKFIDGITASLDENLPALLVKLTEFAKNMIEGLVKGLTNLAHLVGEALVGMAQDAWKKVVNFFQMRSPSKLFVGLGENIVRGWVIGMDQNGSDVSDSIGAIAKNSVTAFKDIIDKISNEVDLNLDINPTIRPVVDLTDVIAGGKKVSTLFGGRTLNVSGTVGNVSSIANGMLIPVAVDQPTQTAQGTSITFIQHNNSPKSLSAIEIYRQTRNQLTALKGLV